MKRSIYCAVYHRKY